MQTSGGAERVEGGGWGAVQILILDRMEFPKGTARLICSGAPSAMPLQCTLRAPRSYTVSSPPARYTTRRARVRKSLPAIRDTRADHCM
jgi:hypothetical protein